VGFIEVSMDGPHAILNGESCLGRAEPLGYALLQLHAQPRRGSGKRFPTPQNLSDNTHPSVPSLPAPALLEYLKQQI